MRDISHDCRQEITLLVILQARGITQVDVHSCQSTCSSQPKENSVTVFSSKDLKEKCTQFVSSVVSTAGVILCLNKNKQNIMNMEIMKYNKIYICRENLLISICKECKHCRQVINKAPEMHGLACVSPSQNENTHQRGKLTGHWQKTVDLSIRGEEIT